MRQMPRCFALMMLVGGLSFAQPGVSLAAQTSPLSICILPVHATGVTDDDATLIADAVRTKCAADARFDVADKGKALLALKEAKPDASGDCISADCVVPAGEKAQTAFAAAATLGKIGTLFTFTVALYNVKEKRRILYRDYQYRGSIEDFYTDVPRRVATDIGEAVFPETRAQEPSRPAAQPTTTETVPILDNGEEPARPLEKVVEEPANTGMATAPAIGVTGRVAMGVLGQDQSRWGALLWYVHPTTPHSEARIKVGMPLAGNDSIYSSGIPDLYLSIEHEWGFRYFGVGAGLAVMQMKTAEKSYYSSQFWDPYQNMYVYDNVMVHFPERYCFNWVLDIRAGKPNMGFRGRISWPIPFNESVDDPTQNAFFEYSALGEFGNSLFKAGVGIAGMQRNRTTSATNQSGVSSQYTINDSYLMAPCGKIAFLIANHSVVCLGLDFMGILVPRSSETGSWAPNLQLSYTFSFGKMLSPEVLDGTF
jgi:hypothetical protein